MIYEVALITRGAKDLLVDAIAHVVEEGARTAVRNLGGVVIESALVSCSIRMRIRAPSTIAPLAIVKAVKAATTKAASAVDGSRRRLILWDGSCFLRTVSTSTTLSHDLGTYLMKAAGFSEQAVAAHMAGDAAQVDNPAVLTPAEAAEQADLEPPTDVTSEPLDVLAPVTDTAMPTTAKPRAKRARNTKKAT
jgi:hypothetical protein